MAINLYIARKFRHKYNPLQAAIPRHYDTTNPGRGQWDKYEVHTVEFDIFLPKPWDLVKSFLLIIFDFIDDKILSRNKFNRRSGPHLDQNGPFDRQSLILA